MGKVPTFEQVWPQYVPEDWWGPEWREVVNDALAYYADSVEHDLVGDAGDYAHGFADGWPSVYNAEIAEAFHRLGLWAVGSVGDYLHDFDGRPFDDPDGGQDFIRGATAYLYAAARMAMEAVLCAAAAITDDEEGEE